MKKVKYMLALLLPLLIASCNAGKEKAKAVPEIPKKIVVNMDSLLEDCRLHTVEMAKADSETYRRGYRYDMLGDSIPMVPYEERKGTVQEVCKDAEATFLTEEQIQKLDSWLVNSSEYELVRNADRTLDTVVNHQRIIFTIEP